MAAFSAESEKNCRLRSLAMMTRVATCIHALRKKPMALIDLVYRDQLFPRRA
jgi:hypothetical protein